MSDKKNPPKNSVAEPKDWSPGDVVLDMYEVRALVGRGGMGNVYLVYHRGWDIELAVKCPNRGVLKNEKGTLFFERECETWVNLGQHPNVATCYYVRRIEGVPRVFMEYVGGGTLSWWIHNRRLYFGDAVLERMLDITIQFAWGLRYAHAQGLVHHDIKPLNVLMTDEGLCKVTDFGLARAMVVATAENDAQVSRLRGIGSRGTPAYCSPEQSRREALNAASDTWSWAVSVLEMFAGDVTWMAGPSAGRALDNYLELGGEDSRIPSMPPGLVKLLSDCFHESPENRPESMGAVIESLLGIYRESIGQDYPRARPEAVETSANRLNNRAISLLDLGKKEEALSTWQRALRLEPEHPESNYNHAMYLWREGFSTDRSVLHTVKRLHKDSRDAQTLLYMLAQIHLERGDYEAALRSMRKLNEDAFDGRNLATAIAHAEARVGATRRLLAHFGAHDGKIKALALNGDVSRVLVGTSRGELTLWRTENGECAARMALGKARVNCVALTGNGQYAVAGLSDGSVQLWTLDGKQEQVLTAPGSVTALVLTDDGRHVIAGYSDGSVRVWDLVSGACAHLYAAHQSGVTALCLGLPGNTALTAREDGTVSHWEIATGTVLRTFNKFAGPIISLAVSQDRHYVLGGDRYGALEVIDLKIDKRIGRRKGHSDAVSSVCLSKRGHYALSCGSAGKLRLWDMENNRCLHTFDGFAPVSLSADDTMAVCTGPDGSLLLYYVGMHASGHLAPLMLSKMH